MGRAPARAAAVSAGLVPFAMGSETFGSIVDPCMRCGTTGLRPTFGRVPRTGAMTLSWSHDKLGPSPARWRTPRWCSPPSRGPTRPTSRPSPSRFAFDATRSVKGLKLGVVPAWMSGPAASAVEPEAIKALEQLGMRRVDLTFPDLPWAALQSLVLADSAASFEHLTLSGEDAQLRMQVRDAWPNLFRQSRFISAVDYVQADRLRRHVARVWAEQMAKVDVMLTPVRSATSRCPPTPPATPVWCSPAGWVMIDRLRSDWLPPPGPAAPGRVAPAQDALRRLADRAPLGRGDGVHRGDGARGGGADDRRASTRIRVTACRSGGRRGCSSGASAASDLAALAALNADPRVMEYLRGPMSLQDSAAQLARFRQHWEEHGFGWWAVEVPGVAPFIGWVGLARPRFEAHFTPCVEIGWRLAAAFWNQGYATEGAHEALRFGWELASPRLEEIVAFTVPATRAHAG